MKRCFCFYSLGVLREASSSNKFGLSAAGALSSHWCQIKLSLLQGILSREMTRDRLLISRFAIMLNHKVPSEALVFNIVACSTVGAEAVHYCIAPSLTDSTLMLSRLIWGHKFYIWKCKGCVETECFEGLTCPDRDQTQRRKLQSTNTNIDSAFELHM